jgi:hypothetical protein
LLVCLLFDLLRYLILKEQQFVPHAPLSLTVQTLAHAVFSLDQLQQRGSTIRSCGGPVPFQQVLFYAFLKTFELYVGLCRLRLAGHGFRSRPVLETEYALLEGAHFDEALSLLAGLV